LRAGQTNAGEKNACHVCYLGQVKICRTTRRQGVRCTLLAGLALACAALPAGAQGRRLLDEVVAVVEAQTITLSELEAEARIQLVLLRGPQVADVSLSRPLLAATLRRLVDERVVLAEVERLRLFDLEKADVEREQRRLREKFATVVAYEAFLRQLELTDDEVGLLLARSLRVARYLDSRLRLPSQLRDAELDEAARSSGAVLSKAQREELRQRLQREKYERLLLDLLTGLRRRAAVRVLDALDEKGPSAP
jgi:hypothetical protein